MSNLPEKYISANLSVIYSICDIVSHATDWKITLSNIVNKISNICPFDFMYIHHQESDEQLQIVYARSLNGEEPGQNQFDQEQILASLVIQNNQILVQKLDNTTDQNNPQEASLFLGIPLSLGQNERGTFVITRHAPPFFSQEEIEFCNFIATQLSFLIERQNLRQAHELIEYQNQQARFQESFISHITHELRNPLGCIKGFATTLTRTDVEWDRNQQREFLQIIDQETDHLQELIDNLLDVARIQTGKLELNLQSMRFETFIKDWANSAIARNPEITIQLEINRLSKPVMGDKKRLYQVLENLYNNVVKHAPKSSIWIKIIDVEQGMKLSFADHGPGIPPQYLEKIFDRFFKLPGQIGSHQGSGLGLFLCKKIVQAHQGQISAISILGKGTEINIYIPFQM